jgi:hypothetical protein
MMDLNGFRRKRSRPNFKYYPGIRLGGLRKTAKPLSHDNRSPGRDLNPGPSEYEVTVLITRPLRSVTTARERMPRSYDFIVNCFRLKHRGSLYLQLTYLKTH